MQGDPRDTDADTRVCGLFEGGSLTDPDLQGLVDTGEAKAQLKRLCVTHEDTPVRRPPPGDHRRARQGGRVQRREGARRGRRRGHAAPRSSAPSRSRGPRPRRTAPSPGSSRARCSRLLRLRPLQVVEGRGRRLGRRDRLARGGRRRRGRGGRRPRHRGRAERRARPPEPAVERLHARVPRRARAGDRRMRTTRSRSRCSAATRSSRWGWARSPSVAQGSDAEPQLIVLRYKGGGDGPHLGLRRQGRHLRHRRDLDQALGEDARDEVRHVGRRRGDRVDRRDRDARRCRRRSPRSCPPRRTCRAGTRSSRATSSPR